MIVTSGTVGLGYKKGNFVIVLIKKLFSSFTQSNPVIELVEFTDGLLAFRCDRSLPFEAVNVSASTDLGPIAGRVDVCSYDASQRLYRAEVHDTARTLAKWNIPARGTSRLKQSLRVSSPQLPNFFALTEDVSVSGIRVLTDSPLQVGLLLEMSLDLDDPAVPTIRLSGEVRWSSRKADGTYHSGVRFVGIERGHHRTVERYVSERLAVQRRVHGEG